MKQMTLLLAAALAINSPLQAEVPVLRDRILTIDEAVVIEGNEPVYYGGIRMQADAEGTFSIIQAERRNLALIEKAEVVLAESYPVQVSLQVSGTLSVACVALEETSVTRQGNVFTVVIAETTLPPGSVCMSLVAVTPFQLHIPLATGLPAGHYRVEVNGSSVEFTL